MEKPNRIIIAIDGHSGCGKSTVAKELAKRLGYIYIDTGAMYRTVTLFALRNGLAADKKVDEPGLIARMGEVNIEFRFNPKTLQNETYLNGENVEEEIRQLPVANHVSPVATIKEVRAAMVKLQQKMGENKGIVMDGRDIGTVVFPNAELKIFMTASPEVRAQRRYDELTEKGQTVDFNEILQNVMERDRIDSSRAASPLKQADDALLLDNSHISREEQFRWVLEKAEKRIGK
ncbi:MAG: cytidylate kinase [Bacteroidetes bacterium GWF2_42_66]|nr:MAG: cytidylate kinase [Bacteroidetes bacterium GWA2_42_15]OFX99408.1 MAG: cytidylate kinase [Bacteroidetes bacterium GWE2_42_39]OFY40460.1 MAG: cytidylate kinase [Bacteroidetes bacterium GWF2_42_66]HBL76918.1 (d)CMP kinase [Prolixibacteraceae bacterium]HCU62702.1 (d)CMP kinase [Prolixibacteraceae bacterium]